MEAKVEAEWRDDGAPGVRGLGFEATPANWATSGGDLPALHTTRAGGLWGGWELPLGEGPPSHPHPRFPISV